MDRTREFNRIVEATEIQQPAAQSVDFFGDLHALRTGMHSALGQLDRVTAYEVYRVAPLLERAQEAVRAMRAFQLPERAPGITNEVLEGLRVIVRADVLRATLRLNEARRRCSNRAATSDEQQTRAAAAPGTAGQSMHMSQSEAAVAQELVEAAPVHESVRERKRIVRSISEIGQIVEDISIHVSLQGEQLRRIDDVMARTENWNKRALDELKLTWHLVSENRGTMYKFFGAWFCVFLIFWFVKR
ncbi:hypothetical protein PAPHI01_2351 [Pancytospora philotis]|nr:hypothetical protein PAPHI01_2351 [Pancytospora philotis]